MSRLNGWQRLWLVLSVLLLIPVCGLAALIQENTDRVEDPVLLAKLESDSTAVNPYAKYRDQVAGKFDPATAVPAPPPGFVLDAPAKGASTSSPHNGTSDRSTGKNFFDQFDKPETATQSNPLAAVPTEQLQAAVRQHFEEEAKKAHALNESARQRNRVTWMVAAGSWIVIVASIYALGAAIAWILRGFRTTTTQ